MLGGNNYSSVSAISNSSVRENWTDGGAVPGIGLASLTLDLLEHPCEIELSAPEETNESFAEGTATSLAKEQFEIA